jgi:hypothetical protein
MAQIRAAFQGATTISTEDQTGQQELRFIRQDGEILRRLPGR